METKINFLDNSKVVVKPLDDIDFSNSNKFEEKLQEVFNDNYKKIIIDCFHIINQPGDDNLFSFRILFLFSFFRMFFFKAVRDELCIIPSSMPVNANGRECAARE